jgi:hypothetical protein
MSLSSAIPQPALSAFQHRQSAHCESGVISSLLHHEGRPFSEAMVFGLSSSLSFAYIPFVKINQLPLIGYRMVPRFILKGMKRQLRLPLRFETFRSSADGRRRLDELIDQGRPVGLQSSVFFLPYFPVNMRFHFNAHNLVAYGREGNVYLISDPVFNAPTRCALADLQRARFVRGALAPKGLLYYFDGPLPKVDHVPLLRGAIRKNCFLMLSVPVPFVGCGGIRLLARRVLKLPAKKDLEFTRRFVGHIVRMQEEIGTGGAGFRFLYAAFLQEAAALLNNPRLQELSLELTAIGDEWREFALHAARMNKGRAELDLPLLHGLLMDLAAKESAFYTKLRRAV